MKNLVLEEFDLHEFNKWMLDIQKLEQKINCVLNIFGVWFRKPTAEEEELIYGSKEMGDIFKKKRFVHPDIRPYDELKESSKAYDRCITAGIPLVVNNNT